MTSNPTDLIERAPGLIADRWENCDSITAEWIEAAANTLTQQESEIERLKAAISWIEPPFVDENTDEAEMRMRIKFCIDDSKRAALSTTTDAPIEAGAETA